MKLRDHPKFPKEKEYREDSIVEQMRGIGDDGAYEKGYNVALRELGELEILEELDFTTIKNIVSNLICRIVNMYKEKIHEELLNNEANLATDKIMRFGTKKLTMKDAPPKENGEYQCEHARQDCIQSDCIWCNMSVLEKIRENYNKLRADSINKGG